MLNKKAIAAFAAGATLLSGMAFAAPAFAETAPKQETCKPADAAKLTELKHAVTVAERNVSKKENALADKKDELDAKKEAYAAKKAVADAYNNALKAYNDAKTGDKKDDTTPKQLEALKEAFAKAGKAAKAFTAADKTKPFAATAKESVDDNPTDLDAGPAITDQELKDAKHELQDAKDELQDAKDALAKAQCTPASAPQPGPKPGPQSTQPGSVKDADAAKADVMVKAAAYDAARVKNAAAKADAQKAYEEAAKAKKADEAAQAEVEAAQKAVDLFAGDKTSKEYKDLNDRLDRAKAKKTFTENTFKAAAAKYAEKQAAFDAANAEAQKAYDAYKAAVNVAAAFGVDVTKLPVVVAMDPLDKTFPGFADAQQLYRDAQSGKFGPAAAAAAKGAANGAAAAADKKADKQGKITVEKGKDKAGKNLPKTGAAIALTALAASVLAGMGAAVRKVRH